MNIKDLKQYIEEKKEENEEIYYDILENIPSCMLDKREDLCNKVHDLYLVIETYKDILDKFKGDSDED